MDDLYSQLVNLIDLTASWIWSYMIYILFIVGAWLTYKTGFIQFRKFRDSLKLVLQGAMGKGKDKSREGDVSPFAALSTALAATVGNGNIGGVATALFWGGPGAIFWMWVCGFIGMATKYAEALLGVHFREKYPDGTIAGGPMYYIKNGLKNKRLAIWLASAFAIFGAFAALFGTGNMMQANQMALSFDSQFGIPKYISGIAITILVGLVIIGGIKRIAMVAEKLVPTMIVIYFAFGLFVIIEHYAEIPKVFALIFSYAFTPSAAVGGFLGSTVSQAIQFGFRRGLLSNEAGLGSAPIAHAAAQTPSPVHQGLIGSMEVFIDTIVVCTLTALINISTGMWQSGLEGTAMTAASFSEGIPIVGGFVVAVSSFLFGYTTLLGWCYYGEQCLKFLFGIKVTYTYRIIYILLMFIGSIASIKLVFFVGDIANAFMAFPNLIALALLGGTVGTITKTFFDKYKNIEDFK
ncbi:MAG: sodium:alanine symporter family protein [Bacteroidota bacterium]|nr:sodium:alanine symporter family protein [Bacteroidota bacterium]